MGGSINPVKIIKKAFKAIVNVVKAVVKFVGDVVGFVFNPMGAFDVPTGPQNPEQEAQGVTITKTGTNVAIPVVYGFRRVGGNLIYAETNGSSNKYLYCVFALCEGEIQGVKRILVEDVELPLPSNTYATNTTISVTTGRFANRIQFQIFNGTETQGQSSLANEAATWKTKSRKLPGVAYAVMRFEWKEIKTQEDQDNNPFSGGIPKVQFDVLGKKVYDVRTHIGGKDLSNDYADLPKGYSFNPANCLLDYMMNPRWGCGLAKEEIDADTFKIAANKYEQTVTYYTGQTGRAMTLNGVVNTDSKLFDNVKQLLSGCRGIMPYVQGRYKLKVEDGGNATDITSTTVDIAFDVDKNNIIGGITLQGERKDSKFNEVIVNFVDPDLNFSNQQVYYSVNGDQAADGGELLKQEFNFPMLTNKSIAQDIAKLIYEKSRQQTSISFSATQELLQVEVGDIIRVTDSVLNLTDATYRVVDMKLNLDLTVDITAVEHDATVYPFTSGEQVEIPPPLFLPDEISVRPRQRTVPVRPLGIVPPEDPDTPVDSAGQPVFDSAGTFDSAGSPDTPAPINPPPEPPPAPPPTIIDWPTSNVNSTFIGNLDTSGAIKEYAPNYGYVYRDVVKTTLYKFPGFNEIYFLADDQKGLATLGLADTGDYTKPSGVSFYSSTHRESTYNGVSGWINNNSLKAGDFIHYRNSDVYAKSNSAYNGGTFFRVLLIKPTMSSIFGYGMRGYAQDGTAITNVLPFAIQFRDSVQEQQIQTRRSVLSQDDTPIHFIDFYWIQQINGSRNEFRDGSDLGQDYTYYNPITKKNVTARNIQAFLNSAIQNPDTIMRVSGASGGASNVASSVTTTHNLGG